MPSSTALSVNNQKGFVPLPIILVAVVVIALLGGVYFYNTRELGKGKIPEGPEQREDISLDGGSQVSSGSTSSQKISGFKTYVNEKYKFFIDYPDNLKHEQSVFEEPDLSNKKLKKELISLDKWFNDNSTVFIYSYPEGAPPQLEFYALTKSDETISVAGQKVNKKVGMEISSETGTLIWVGPLKSREINYMLIFSSGNQKADTENIAAFDQMVSTFKFID